MLSLMVGSQRLPGRGVRGKRREGREKAEAPGILVPTLPRGLFPPHEEEALSGSESPLLKITCLSIIPTAALWDSMFQGPRRSLGTGTTGQEGLCPGQESVQTPVPHRPDSGSRPHQSSCASRSWGIGSSGESPGSACGVLWSPGRPTGPIGFVGLSRSSRTPSPPCMEPSKKEGAASSYTASSSASPKHPWLGPEGTLQGLRGRGRGGTPTHVKPMSLSCSSAAPSP